jgi:hypothetical protein
MMAATPESLQPYSEPCLTNDDALQKAALELFQSSGYAALRNLRCEVVDADVIVRGEVPSFYLKILAQHLVLSLDRVRSVTNLVDVRD